MGRKLTSKQVETLRGFKGQEDGPMKFFEYLEEVYSDNKEKLKKIELCKEMRLSIADVEYPNAGAKAETMFCEWMDDLLEELGYSK